MRKNNQNGFTLILSLVLLLVMSLMGGSLIVISAGDHQSNNTSDQYQQTFYVAEHALKEAEKEIINRMLGPWLEINNIPPLAPGADVTEITLHDNYITELTELAGGADQFARHTDGREIPRNLIRPTETKCFNSFRNLIREINHYMTQDDLAELDALVAAGQMTQEARDAIYEGDFKERGIVLVTSHQFNLNFGEILAPIIGTGTNVGLTANEAAEEIEYLSRYRYEFFSINAGTSKFKGAGTSLKKTATNAQRQGTAYRIYGCGYLMPRGMDEGDFLTTDPEILIPLESLVILSS